MNLMQALTEVQAGKMARRLGWMNRKFVIMMAFNGLDGVVVLTDALESFKVPYVPTDADISAEDWVLIEPDHFEFLDCPVRPIKTGEVCCTHS